MRNDSCSGGNGALAGQWAGERQLEFNRTMFATVRTAAGVWRHRFGQDDHNPQDVDWSPAARTGPGAIRWEGANRVELFFGLGKSDGAVTSERVWGTFAERDLGRCFPQGFTVVHGVGVWASEQEPARVVIAFTDRPQAELAERLERLAHAWCRLAGQQEVLAVVTPSPVLS